MNFTENDVTMYCDDKPFAGLSDIQFSAICADDVHEYISGKSGSISFSASLSACVCAAGICAALNNLRKPISDAVDSLLFLKNSNPKWWHYYKHSSNARIRKKYFKRLYRQAFGGNA